MSISHDYQVSRLPEGAIIHVYPEKSEISLRGLEWMIWIKIIE